MEHLDLQVDVYSPTYKTLTGPKPESSKNIRKRVEGARAVQIARQGVLNAKLSTPIELTTDGKYILEQATKHIKFTPLTCTKILKVARTIADMEQTLQVLPHHVAEAVQYQTLGVYNMVNL
jgi:magnesium chelatase family protein